MTGARGDSSPGAPPLAPDPAREAFSRYLALLDKVTDFWDRAVAAQPEAFACEEGCSACCTAGLTVLPVEAAAIQAHLATLAPEAREPLSARLCGHGSAESCALLVDGRCAVYPARPVICRTHGLALRLEDRIDSCPLCFVSEAPRPEGVLSLETLNTLLVLVNRHWLAAQCLAEDSPRVAIVSLAESR